MTASSGGRRAGFEPGEGCGALFGAHAAFQLYRAVAQLALAATRSSCAAADTVVALGDELAAVSRR